MTCQKLIELWIPPLAKASPADRPTASPRHDSLLQLQSVESRASKRFWCLEAAMKPSGGTPSLQCHLGQCSNWHVWLDPFIKLHASCNYFFLKSRLHTCHVDDECVSSMSFFSSSSSLRTVGKILHVSRRLRESCTLLCFCLFATRRILNGSTHSGLHQLWCRNEEGQRGRGNSVGVKGGAPWWSEM